MLLVTPTSFSKFFTLDLQSLAGDTKDMAFLNKALRGVRAVIAPTVCVTKRP